MVAFCAGVSAGTEDVLAVRLLSICVLLFSEFPESPETLPVTTPAAALVRPVAAIDAENASSKAAHKGRRFGRAVKAVFFVFRI